VDQVRSRGCERGRVPDKDLKSFVQQRPIPFCNTTAIPPLVLPVQITRTIARIPRRVAVPEAVLERRRTWTKYGRAAASADDVKLTLRTNGDIIRLERPGEESEKDEVAALTAALAAARQKGSSAAGGSSKWASRFENSGLTEDSVPPGMPGSRMGGGMRGGGMGSGSGMGGDRDDDKTRLRLSPLSLSRLPPGTPTSVVMDEEMREVEAFLHQHLDRPFQMERLPLSGRGRPWESLFLQRNRETDEFRGVVFINFPSKRHAELAKDLLTGIGFNHMVIHAEFAKPLAPRRPREGGPAMSGWGKALPQNM
jgi:hypothetical protein